MSGYGGPQGVSLRAPVTPMVGRIISANVAVYVLAMLLITAYPAAHTWMEQNLFLVHADVFGSLHLWKLGTYAWLHDLGPSAAKDPAFRLWPLWSLIFCTGACWGIVALYRSRFVQGELFVFLILAFAITMLVGYLGFGAPMHLLGNMIALYFFGHYFEKRWGPRRFLLFWLYTTAGGGLLSTLLWYVLPTQAGPMVVGASAGSVGLVVAFAVYYADQTILYGLVLPLRSRHLLWVVLIFDAVVLFASLVRSTPPDYSLFAHFGGALTAYLLTTGYWRPSKVLRRFGGPPSGGSSRKKKQAPHLRLLPPPDDDGDDPPRYLH